LTDAKPKTGGAPQGALPLAPARDADTRILCWRYPIGWDRWEVRLEAHRANSPDDFGHIFISDDEGNRVELTVHVLRELADTLGDAIKTIYADRDAFREAQTAKAGEHA
jgi:hypothetical protein